MRLFDVYFEFYGRKMKTQVLSDNEESAKDEIKNKIIFYKIEQSKDPINHFIDVLENLTK